MDFAFVLDAKSAKRQWKEKKNNYAKWKRTDNSNDYCHEKYNYKYYKSNEES